MRLRSAPPLCCPCSPRIALVYWWFAYRILERKQPRYQPLEAPKAA